MGESMNKRERFKTHWASNKKLYLGLGAGAVIGAVTAVLLRKPDVIQTALASCGSTALNAGRDLTHNNVVVCELERQGHPGNMILWVEKGIVLPSQNMMAKAAGVTPTNLSRYLRGIAGSEVVDGQTFVNLGEMAGSQE